MLDHLNGKIEVEIGEQLSHDLMTSDGSVVLCKAGTIVTRELVDRLSKWLVEKGAGGMPSMPQSRMEAKKSIRTNILRKLDFQQTLTLKAREKVENGYTKIFGKLKSDNTEVEVPEIESLAEQIVENTSEDTDTPLKLFEMKQHSSYIYNHSLECGIIASFLATSLNYSQEDTASLVTAMILHDVGMLDIPGDILRKKTPLSDSEREFIQGHPALSWKKLRDIPGMDPLAMLIGRGHHVYADESGYPWDVSINDLPAIACLAPLIDHFEAMTAPRPHRQAMTLHNAVKTIIRQKEKYYPSAFENFISVVGIYPVSTFLLLLSGEVGVVVRNNPENLFLPEVKLVLDPSGAEYSKEIIVSLADDESRKPVQVVDEI